MNVFYTDSDPQIAASNLCDQHVIKMTLEVAQILSTIYHICHSPNPSLNPSLHKQIYKPTHKDHPIIIAAKENPTYRLWITLHGIHLANEYTRRFNKIHKSLSVIKLLHIQSTSIQSTTIPIPIPTQIPICTLPHHHTYPTPTTNPITIYRRAIIAKYRGWRAINRPARYTNAKPPNWLTS